MKLIFNLMKLKTKYIPKVSKYKYYDNMENEKTRQQMRIYNAYIDGMPIKKIAESEGITYNACQHILRAGIQRAKQLRYEEENEQQKLK